MLITFSTLQDSDIEIKGPVVVTIVRTANLGKDLFSNLRGFIGGKMTHYESLIQTATEEAIEQLKVKAKQKNYHGVMTVKLYSPTVVVGGVEIIACGDGWIKTPK